MENEWIRIYRVGTLSNEISEELLEPIKERARNIFLDTDIEYELDLDSEVKRTKTYIDTYYYVYICVQAKDEEMAKYYIDKFLQEEGIELSKIVRENEVYNDDENIE